MTGSRSWIDVNDEQAPGSSIASERRKVKSERRWLIEPLSVETQGFECPEGKNKTEEEEEEEGATTSSQRVFSRIRQVSPPLGSD